ncbi:hypothetical protein ACRRVB_02045 [Candidatus Cardinium hertigii]|uniref:hypothetical protein n=1 Tax=Candidatus Cardinium hertigii TaxID=247481 RepID=UPI003D7E4C3A
MLQPDSAYTSIISNPEKKQETIEKLAALEDAFKRLASNSKAVRRLLSEEISSIPQPSLDPTYNHPIIYAEPFENIKKQSIYSDPIDTKIEEPIYATIGEENPEEHVYSELFEGHTYGNLVKEQTTEL